ncbi:MAG: hypothetical protein ABR499_19850 [Gemmatimonadaceae bacterium]
MFVDDRQDEGSNEGHERNAPHAGRPEQRQRPVTDREVPLDRHGGLSAAVHAWLDGEIPEAAVRKGDTAKDVEFWQMIAQETAQMRRVRTPPHVEALIMDALPHTAPQMITPWYRRELLLTPAAVVASAVALIAITAAITALLLSATR